MKGDKRKATSKEVKMERMRAAASQKHVDYVSWLACS